ncbi:MAG: WecB/TagA/CpsF family glycosyltransferase [Bacteroidales bacterium]|nr:WecB/TagA/CpsF family glycosyltransferase [Bacteroidales bacterium]
MEYRYINGIKLNAFQSEEQLIDYASEHKGILIAINAEKIYYASEQTREIINDNISYADGVGAVYALRCRGLKKVKKIAGCELWYYAIKKYHTAKSFYLIGSTTEVIEKVVEQLKEEFADINICGYRNGYIKGEKEEADLINDIADKKPDFVFVAMGSPKQEILMQKMLERHKAVYQGLGGSFDVYVGKVKRATSWWINNNLEWLYRLIKQPKRIKRQYVFIYFLFYLTFKKKY